MHTCMHVCTHTHTLLLWWTQRFHFSIHTHTHHMHARTHARTHAHTHTHSHSLTHTHWWAKGLTATCFTLQHDRSVSKFGCPVWSLPHSGWLCCCCRLQGRDEGDRHKRHALQRHGLRGSGPQPAGPATQENGHTAPVPDLLRVRPAAVHERLQARLPVHRAEGWAGGVPVWPGWGCCGDGIAGQAERRRMALHRHQSLPAAGSAPGGQWDRSVLGWFWSRQVSVGEVLVTTSRCWGDFDHDKSMLGCFWSWQVCVNVILITTSQGDFHNKKSVVVWFSSWQVSLDSFKGDPKWRYRVAWKTEKMCKGFEWWLYHYLCNWRTFSFWIWAPMVQPHWFALFWWRAEKDRLLLHLLTLFITSQIQSARYKMVVLTALFFHLSNIYFRQTR